MEACSKVLGTVGLGGQLLEPPWLWQLMVTIEAPCVERLMNNFSNKGLASTFCLAAIAIAGKADIVHYCKLDR